MKKLLVLMISGMLLMPGALAEGTAVTDAGTEAAVAVSAETQLPPYTYTGEDDILAAVLDYTVEMGKDYYMEAVNVTIPSPVVVRVDRTDDTHATVYGDFWVFNYTPDGTTLLTVSGGQDPAVLELQKEDGEWKVTNVTQADDGEGWNKSISDMCNGDRELEQQMFAAADGSGKLLADARMHYITEYVQENGLAFTAYKDYGWDAVPLESAAAEQ